MRIPISDLGSVGVVKDIFSHDTPPEAWTAVQNARMGPYGAERFLGHARTMGTDSAGWAVAPYWLFYVPVAGATDMYLGCGQQKVYCRTAATPYTETNITRQSGGVDVNYAATELGKWNGGFFGGPFILNNGVDEPQVWNPTSAATKLVNLSTTATGSDAWPSNYYTRCIRPYGRYLVAIDILKNTSRYPQLVKWSHPADPGSLPTSWDPTNVAKDAGEYPLSDAAGDLVDQLVLRNQNIIYSTDDVWAMTRVGGESIFRFDRLFGEQGALYTNCVAAFKKSTEYHAVLAGDDIYIHNGQAPQSIITPEMRKWFFQQIDPTYYQRSFVVSNPLFTEVWFCIPQLGAEQPTLALVWNWQTGAIGFRDLLVATSNGDTRGTAGTNGTPCIAPGKLDDVSAEAWSADSLAWDTDTTIWDARSTNPATARLFMLDRSAGKRTYILDYGSDFDTASFTWGLERVGLAILGTDRQGKPKVDTEKEKLLLEVWPRIEAALGTTINVSIGTQERPEDPVNWSANYAYVVGTTQFLPTYHTGRYLSIKYTYTGTASARLMGYDLDITDAGAF